MEQVQRIWNESLLGRFLAALCLWFSRQWQTSRVIQTFLAPPDWEERGSRSSIFYLIWKKLHQLLCFLFRALGLDRLFTGSLFRADSRFHAGSIFRQSWLFVLAAAALAPLLPTMAVLGLAALGYASLALRFALEPERELVYASPNRYIFLYGAVYFVSIFLSVSPRSSLKGGLLSVAFLLFALVVENSIQRRSQLDLLVDGLVLAGAAVALIGLYQFVFRTGYQDAAWVDSDMFSSISFRVASTLDNPNMLGQYFILMIPLGGAGLLGAKSWEKRLFYFICCALMTVCILLTFSRGAWLGLLFAGIFFVLMLNPRLILLAPVALVALYFLLPDTIISRFSSIGDMSDNSTSYRVYIWMGTLAMLKDYWLSGIGPGVDAFNLVYPAYSYNSIVAPHAHNLFLQIVCDAGICALVVFILMGFHYTRTLAAAIRAERDTQSRLLQIALLSGVAGFMVQAMTDYSFYNYRVMFLFWVYIAVGLLAARRGQLKEGGVFEP